MRLVKLVNNCSQMVYEEIIRQGFEKKDVEELGWSLLTFHDTRRRVLSMTHTVDDEEWQEPWVIGDLIKEKVLSMFN